MINHFPVAEDVAELLDCPDRYELPKSLEIVTNIFASHGLDVRDIMDDLLRALSLEAEWVSTWYGRWIGASTVTDDEIAACYRQLRNSAESGDEETYKQVMARLRRLQAAEAQQIRGSFEADEALDHARVGDALRRADELLAQYESPPH